VADALLDSTTYIDLEKALKHRQQPWAVNSVSNALAYTQQNGNPFLSVVTVVELLRGLHRNFLPVKVERFKQRTPLDYQFLDVTTEIAYLGAEIIGKLEKARQTIGFPDSLIAATAIHHRLELVTSNDRQFQRVINLGYPLTLRNWREP